jgi:hypothetical protein
VKKLHDAFVAARSTRPKSRRRWPSRTNVLRRPAQGALAFLKASRALRAPVKKADIKLD